jgi:chorismate dehydratase
MSLLKVATVDYLNARPLVRGFTHGEQKGTVELVGATPARCAELLRSGQVDVALIPSIEYLRIPALSVLPGIAIASRKRARSVLLVSRVAAPDIRSVALDSSSRTSAALLRILLERRSKHRVIYSDMAPSLPRMLEHCDAALLIGDAALTATTQSLKVYDLAGEWHDMTGLPFVFAFWAVRQGADRALSASPFRDSKLLGLAQREIIAKEASAELGLSASDLTDYLYTNIHYDLGQEEIRSLWLFYRFARESSLVGAAREVTLYGGDLGAEDRSEVGGAP